MLKRNSNELQDDRSFGENIQEKVENVAEKGDKVYKEAK